VKGENGTQLSVVEHPPFWRLQGRVNVDQVSGHLQVTPHWPGWLGHSGCLPRRSTEGHTGSQTNRRWLLYSTLGLKVLAEVKKKKNPFENHFVLIVMHKTNSSLYCIYFS